MPKTFVDRHDEASEEDRRAAPRFPVHIRSIILDATLNDHSITIINISTQGLLAQSTNTFEVGALVAIDAPGLGHLNAVIRWSGSGLIGCEFIDPIDPDSFFSFIEKRRTA